MPAIRWKSPVSMAERSAPRNSLSIVDAHLSGHHAVRKQPIPEWAGSDRWTALLDQVDRHCASRPAKRDLGQDLALRGGWVPAAVEVRQVGCCYGRGLKRTEPAPEGPLATTLLSRRFDPRAPGRDPPGN